MKNLSNKTMKNINPFHIFPEKQRILLAPTCVAATNIDGITIHTALEITVDSKLYSLNDCQR